MSSSIETSQDLFSDFLSALSGDFQPNNNNVLPLDESDLYLSEPIQQQQQHQQQQQQQQLQHHFANNTFFLPGPPADTTAFTPMNACDGCNDLRGDVQRLSALVQHLTIRVEHLNHRLEEMALSPLSQPMLDSTNHFSPSSSSLSHPSPNQQSQQNSFHGHSPSSSSTDQITTPMTTPTMTTTTTTTTTSAMVGSNSGLLGSELTLSGVGNGVLFEVAKTWAKSSMIRQILKPPWQPRGPWNHRIPRGRTLTIDIHLKSPVHINEVTARFIVFDGSFNKLEAATVLGSDITVPLQPEDSTNNADNTALYSLTGTAHIKFNQISNSHHGVFWLQVELTDPEFQGPLVYPIRVMSRDTGTKRAIEDCDLDDTLDTVQFIGPERFKRFQELGYGTVEKLATFPLPNENNPKFEELFSNVSKQRGMTRDKLVEMIAVVKKKVQDRDQEDAAFQAKLQSTAHRFASAMQQHASATRIANTTAITPHTTNTTSSSFAAPIAATIAAPTSDSRMICDPAPSPSNYLVQFEEDPDYTTRGGFSNNTDSDDDDTTTTTTTNNNNNKNDVTDLTNNLHNFTITTTTTTNNNNNSEQEIDIEAVQQAVKQGSADQVRKCLVDGERRRREPGGGWGGGFTPLMVACALGKSDIVATLCEYVPSIVLSIGSRRANAMHICAMFGRTTHAHTLYDIEPALAAWPALNGLTPIMAAIVFKQEKFVEEFASVAGFVKTPEQTITPEAFQQLEELVLASNSSRIKTAIAKVIGPIKS